MKEPSPINSSSDKESQKEEEIKVTFEELGFNDDLLDALDSMNFIHATPVQAKAIPHILKGMDLMGVAQTGTGKTAAFLLPILNLLMDTPYEGKSSCLIVSPTRELAMQIDRQAEALGYFTGISSVAVYGGGAGGGWDQQKKALTSGADIIAATPGRLISHMNMGYVDFSSIKYFILDEADRMLDMGFNKDIEQINKKLPKDKQTLMFSATMPNNIRRLAKHLLKNPVSINIAISKPAKNVIQAIYEVSDHLKVKLIGELLKGKRDSFKKILIFSSTKKAVSGIVAGLRKVGIPAKGISSDLPQKEREVLLRDFTSGKVNVIVATDVLSRGIDIKDIDLVMNYDVPPDPEDYIHRIGRTARAEAKGVAITFVSHKDRPRFSRIEKLLGERLRRSPLPQSISQPPAKDPRPPKGNYQKKKNPRGRKKNNRSGEKK
jgi:superfamily II DNA/RNA helicase